MNHFLHDLIEDKRLVRRLKFEFIAIGVLIIIGSLVMHFSENWDLFDSLYFTVTVLSSVGLGDFAPHTVIGKLTAMIIAIMGVPIFLYTTSIILASRGRKIARDLEQKIEKDIVKQIKNKK